MSTAPCGCPVIEKTEGDKQIMHCIGCSNPSLRLVNGEYVIVSEPFTSFIGLTKRQGLK